MADRLEDEVLVFADVQRSAGDGETGRWLHNDVVQVRGSAAGARGPF